MQDLQFRFPQAPAWGQAGFQEWGLVKPSLQLQEDKVIEKPDVREEDKEGDAEQDIKIKRRNSEDAEEAGEAGEIMPDKLQEEQPMHPRARRPNPRYVGDQWAK
ncbi:hypothetical protein [Oryza sativa Japonica Group]|uniref:Uncharacterized protein n=1 Tax=Oryza sativa subsp. japonica TaxID=39947 RepID=Q5JL27_ORYSJ|nr:hypothetical protein [Oryza sativa Japonica Group]